MRIIRSLALSAFLAACLCPAIPAANAQVSIGFSVNIEPPPLPVYDQPIIPGPGYLWAPGYWAWNPDIDDYYWVPGTWVLPPEPNLLWTPGYWAWNDSGAYVFNDGYWGPEVGFYGGVNYGFGYGAAPSVTFVWWPRFVFRTGYTLSHIHDDDGRMVGATMFFKDLTRVEQIEERERLRDRLAALGEMAAAIAHEVKNPLASIEVMAGVLKRQMTDREEALETLNDIIKEAKMANAIVVEVLEFVRPIQLQVERADINEVLKDSITLAEGKMRRGAVSINTVIEPDVPLLLADPHQLRQLFSNLLANAFEALGGEGHVDIRAWLLPGEDEPVGAVDPQPPQIVVEVRDTGPGIAPEDMERVFSPFFSTKPQGTGLGLAIVRNVVDAHEGHIDAISAPGRGATFKVTLPVVPSERSLGR